MKCPKCNAEIPEGGKFCPKCGHRYHDWKKIFIITGSSLGALLVIVASGVGINAYVQYQNALSDYKTLLMSGDYDSAKEVYQDSSAYNNVKREILQDAVNSNDLNLVISLLESGLYDESEAETAATYICDILNALLERYESLDISYNTIQNDIAVYQNIGNSTIAQTRQSIQSEIESIHHKRAEYEQGIYYMEEENYTSAIICFREVEETNELYSEAQALIPQCIELYEKQTANLEEKLRTEHNYTALLQRLNYLQAYNPTEERSQKIEEITEEYKSYSKETQLLIASADNVIFSNGMYSFDVKLTNYSDKEAKKAEISILCFDDNGNPTKGLNSSQSSNLVSSTMFMLNLQLNETKTYTQKYKQLPDGCKQIKICINTVDFDDNTKWTNKYHNFWIEENKDHY